MTIAGTDVPRTRLSAVAWIICIISAIGFAFDSYVLLMLPLIAPPALQDLLGVPPGHPSINQWVGFLFNIPAIAGGIFGLLGGYLTDLFGRRRVLVWSILLYAFSALFSAFAPSAGWLLFWRCGIFIGVCVEFVAAVAWLSELFPEPKQRESVIGWTQAFGSLGGVMVTGLYYVAVTYADRFPAVMGGHAAWRYTLVSGIIPAIPLILIRPFLPESPVWQQKKEAGTLKRPSFGELFRPQFRRTTIITTVMMACAYAAAFGAIQQMPRIVPGLEEVRSLARPAQQQVVSAVQSFQETGGLLGRIVLAFLAVRILSRRKLLHTFQLPGLIVMPIVFLVVAHTSVTAVQWGIGILGFLTIAQFSFWGNYLPRVYPTYLRGTGESFAANVGGRMLGTTAALVTTNLANMLSGGSAPARLAYASAIVGTLVYIIGFASSFWLPEPKSEDLPD